MNYLKIIFYGILSFIERNPIFCLFFLIIAIVAPFLVKVFLYVILGFLLLALIGIGVAVWRMRKMQRRDKAVVDKISATIILQSYMESRDYLENK